MSNAEDLEASEEQSAESLPLDHLVALLPDEGETDARWGARRQGERIPFCKPVAIRSIEKEGSKVSNVEVEAIFEGWALNVCHGGMRIITEQPLKPGDSIQVEVSSAGRSYLGFARVQWVREEADGVVAGLQFQNEPAK
ncbi:MAG: PilZ domain-containing protein [Polyangiales bacterium]